MSLPWNPTMTGGYTCSSCGQWVPTGYAHACLATPPPIPAPTMVIVDAAALAAQLARIADALEALLARYDDDEQGEDEDGQ